MDPILCARLDVNDSSNRMLQVMKNLRSIEVKFRLRCSLYLSVLLNRFGSFSTKTCLFQTAHLLQRLFLCLRGSIRVSLLTGFIASCWQQSFLWLTCLLTPVDQTLCVIHALFMQAYASLCDQLVRSYGTDVNWGMPHGKSSSAIY